MYFFEDDISDQGKFDSQGDLTGDNVQAFDEVLILKKFNKIREYVKEIIDEAGSRSDGLLLTVSVVNPL